VRGKGDRGGAAPPVADGPSEAAGFTRNAVSSYGLRGLMVLSALLLTPYLYRTLGSGGFGTWSVMFTITTVFNLVEFGFAGGLIKFVAELRGAGRREELDRTVGAGIAALGGLGIVAAAFSLVAATALDGLADPGSRDDFRAGILVLGAAMLLRFPAVGYGAVLIGYQRTDLFNYATVVSTVGFPVLAVAAVEAGTGVTGVAVAYAVTLVAGALVYVPLLARIDPSLSLRPRFRDREAGRRLVGFSGLTLLADSMVFIGQRLDTVVIAAVRSASAAAPFAAAVKLQSGVQSLTLPFVNLLLPMVSELDARGRREEIARRFLLSTRISLQITLPVALALAFFAEDFVGVWLGDTAQDGTAAIIVVLMCAAILSLTATPAEKILVGLGKVKLVGGLSIVEGTLNLVVSIVLVSRYGAVGAALGTLITTALLSPVKIPLAARASGASAARVAREAIGVPVASSAAGIAAMLVVLALMEPGPLRLAVGCSAGLIASSVLALAQIGTARLRLALRAIRPTPAPEGVT
jgi:O-antigen/teichoic acid export membrane protein